MFARKAAARIHAQFENVCAAFLGGRFFALVVRIVKDQRVQISIPSMEDVRNLEVVFLSNLLNLFEHCRQLAEGDHAIHAIVIRNAPKSPERGLAPLPDRGGLLFTLAYAQRHRIEFGSQCL